MNEAFKEAKKAYDIDEVPVGAVIVKDGAVVATGHNRVVIDNDPTAHGEMVAIRNACKVLHTFDLSGCELYTTSEPCPMCKCGIMWANIDKVYYGCTVEDAASIGFRDVAFATQSPDQYQLDRESCLELFARYQRLDTTSY